MRVQPNATLGAPTVAGLAFTALAIWVNKRLWPLAIAAFAAHAAEHVRQQFEELPQQEEVKRKGS
jgi:hypothetical protein